MTNSAISPNQVDVNNAINGGGGFTALSDGDICIIPFNVSTPAWTSGVNVTKAITIIGAGSGRIVAYDDFVEKLTIGTGTLNVVVGGYSPGFTSSVFVTGATLQVFQDNHNGNWMQGTVTGWNSGTNTLTLNITSTNGSASLVHRWLIATMPSTVIPISTAPYIFNVTESTAGHVDISGIQFTKAGNSSGSRPSYIFVNYQFGGLPVLIHDNWFRVSSVASFEAIDCTTNRGVCWNNSFDASSNSDGNLTTTQSFFRIKDPTGANIGGSSWSSVANWGSLDTSGDTAWYLETNDFHTNGAAIDLDDGGRLVFRYNLMDHATFALHGQPDSCPIGNRYHEFYNNTCLFHGYADGTTFNIGNGWVALIRGGTFVNHDNVMPWIMSQDYANQGKGKAAALMMVLGLNFNGGSNPCWGAGTTNGADYPGPRQVGRGYVTGTGTDGKGRTHDSNGFYVGDSEPAYIWGNTNSYTSSFTASISGTTMTVATGVSGYIGVGQTVTGSGVALGTVITARGTGGGGSGTYIVNNSQTIASEAMSGSFASQPLSPVGTEDNGGTSCTAPDTSGNYIHNGRDFWNVGTVLASGSSGTTINVTSTTSWDGTAFPSSGTLSVQTASGYTLCPYTGKTSNSFTGCSNIPTLTVGNSVGLAKDSYTPYTYPHPLTSSASAPTAISPISASIDVGSLLTINLVADGSPAPTFSLQSGSLPSWATLTGNQITGTPTNTTGSPFTPTIRATNASGHIDQVVTITVNSTNAYSISLSAPTLNIGSVFAGQQSSGTIYVTNTGTSLLTINSVTISGQGSLPTYVNAVGSTTIRVGGTAPWTFYYTPLAPNTLNSTIAFNCANSPIGVNTFTLKGTCPGRPKLRVGTILG